MMVSADQPDVAPAERRPSFFILVAISAIGPLALNIFIPSMPGLQETFGISYGMAQLTLTLYLVGMAGSQLLYGPLSDRYGRRPMLLMGLTLFVAASAAAAAAPSIDILIAARLIQAIGGSSGIVLARAMVRDIHTREKSASVIAYITMAFVVAPMVAPAIGGSLDEIAGWRASFWLLAGVGSVILATAWRFLPETHHQRSRSAGQFNLMTGARHLFGLRRFRGYALTLAFGSAVFFAFLGGAPHVMVDVLGRTPLEYGLWFVLISIGYMTGNFLSGRYTEHIGIDRLMLIGTGLTLAGGLLCLVTALVGLLSPVTLFLPMALAALGNGFTIPNGTAGAISVDPRLTGAAAGWSGFAQMACGAAASQLVGSLQDAWPVALFWFMAAASVLSLASHLRSVREPSSSDDATK
jgi:DHA1 family bicyclomycin/chloramphenicol resistance-like MFS transporter